MDKKPLEYFIVDKKDDYKSERNRTLNIPASLHGFLKKTSAQFDIGVSSLVTNILSEWESEYEEEILKEILYRINRKS